MRRIIGPAARALTVLAVAGGFALGLAGTGTAATAQPATCSISGPFAWYQVSGSHPRGYASWNVTTNTCTEPARVFIDCHYVGPRGAYINQRQYGGNVIFGVSSRVCNPNAGTGWNLASTIGGGTSVYYSGGWHDTVRVGS
jgi:hypothetical protein